MNKEAVITVYNQETSQSSGIYAQSSTTQSQYKGLQKQYQPAGQVQSFYQGLGQSTSQGQQQSSTGQFHSSSYRGDQPGHDIGLRADSMQPTQMQAGQQSSTTTGQFHSSNYRGDQPGHDSYLRADSTQPSQSGYQAQSQSQPFQSQSGQSFGSTTNQFHAANYQGNQPGHDSYLRADSTSPSQFGS